MGLATFVRPLLQLAMVLIILLEAAKRLGFSSDGPFLALTARSHNQQQFRPS
jgi:hypothetical protein